MKLSFKNLKLDHLKNAKRQFSVEEDKKPTFQNKIKL
jgi:hypothetical protein